jgi:hypothetical protein
VSHAAPSYDRLLDTLGRYYRATTHKGMPTLPTKHSEMNDLVKLSIEVKHLLEVALVLRDRDRSELTVKRQAKARRLKRMAIEHLAEGHEMTTTGRTDVTRGLINASMAKSLCDRGLVEYLDTNRFTPRRLRATPKLIAQVTDERVAALHKIEQRAAREEVS